MSVAPPFGDLEIAMQKLIKSMHQTKEISMWISNFHKCQGNLPEEMIFYKFYVAMDACQKTVQAMKNLEFESDESQKDS